MIATLPAPRLPAAGPAPEGTLRFLFVGGGTGGHLAPALGLAEQLEDRGHDTLFLGSGRSVERNFLVGARPYRSLGIDRGRLPRKLSMLPACWRARREARQFHPDLVVGLGGLAGAAAVAARCGRPLVLLEGNRVAGKGVRLLRPWSRAVLTLFPETAGELRRGVCVGPMGRKDLLPVEAAAARRRLALRPDQPVLLLMGGSQGAQALNETVLRLLPSLAACGTQLLALVGPGKAGGLKQACRTLGVPSRVLEHCREMGLAYSAADLAFCRGGAATVAELWLHALPAVVVPYPHHKDRQQEHNARALAAGVFILDQSALPEAAEQHIMNLLRSPEELERMRAHLLACAPPDGTERAASLLEELAIGKG